MKTVIDKYTSAPFIYGVADCCRFAAECFEALHGRNPMAELSYSGEAEALAIIDRHGTLYDAMCFYLGKPRGSIDEAEAGDVAWLRYNGGEMAAAVAGDVILVRTQNGLMEWPLKWAGAVWGNNAGRR